MRMYLWNRTPVSYILGTMRTRLTHFDLQLMRDGALENDIVVHEMAHVRPLLFTTSHFSKS